MLDAAPGQPPLIEGPAALRSKTALALLCGWALLAAAYFAPTPLRGLLRGSSDGVLGGPAMPTVQRTPGQTTGGAAEDAARARAATAAGVAAQSSAVADASVEPVQGADAALSHFARKLALTAKRERGAITRVVHFGDSLIDLDHITGPLRELHQRRYGDAGHGFSLIAKPWEWYNQRGLGHGSAPGWEILRLATNRGDGRLGLGLAAIERGAGSGTVHLRTSDSVRFSRLELAYLAQPGGGSVQLAVDDKRLAEVATAAPRRGSGFHALRVSDGPHRIAVRGRGRLRLFGLVLERDGPGVVWDNLPAVSLRFHELLRAEVEHFAEQLAHRNPDLIVYQFGANDTINYGGDLPRYGEQVGRVLARARAAVPHASCLVIGPLDRLVRGNGGLHSPASVRRVSDRQREVALAGGCAFWDAQRAMGGAGAMKRWLAQGMALKDMVHLNPKGGAELARRLDRALAARLARLGVPSR